jgi:hypothetical protein
MKVLIARPLRDTVCKVYMISDIRTRPYQLAAAPWVDLVSPLKHKSRLRGSGLRSVARFTDLPTPTSGAHSSYKHATFDVVLGSQSRAFASFGLNPRSIDAYGVLRVRWRSYRTDCVLSVFDFLLLQDAVVVSGGVIEGHLFVIFWRFLAESRPC